MRDDLRTMIVTGASSGIGRELASQSARAGYGVVIVARRGIHLDDVARTIRTAGGACATLAGDVTARDMPAKIVDTALHAFGRIDVIVNNAGRGAFGSLLEQSDAETEAQWQLNVAAPLRVARAALTHLETTRGQLVFIGSSVARVPPPGYGAYSLAKAAIRTAAIQLRRELRSRHIAVTYVDPGVTATEFHSSSGIERSVGFAASPSKVARAILRGIARRSAVVNAVPWQTAFAALGEWSGTLADPIVSRRFGAKPFQRAASSMPPTPATHSVEGERDQRTCFEAALEPVARRMERVRLPPEFLREALVLGATIELGPLAMRWAGMPNKNERAVLREALDALTTAGYLESTEGETWKVVRAVE